MSTLSNSSRKLWWLILVLLFLIVPTLTFSKGGPGIGVLVDGVYYSDIGALLSGSSVINDSAGDGDTTETWSADKIYDMLQLRQSLDAELTALAGLTSAANAIPYFTGSGTAGVISSSANMVSFLGSADYATARTNLGITWTNLGGKPATPGAASLLLHGADGTLANATSFDLALAYDSIWAGDSGGKAAAVSVAAQTVVGRITGGHVDDIPISTLKSVTTNSKSGAYTIGTDNALECYGGVIYVTSAATMTACDGLASGMNFSVVTIGAIAVSLDTQSDDLMYLDGVALHDGDKATNKSTAGDIISCIYYDATGWFCASNGWTDGGA
jgi:hypothetical protein